jgi:stage II sporulation protein M
MQRDDLLNYFQGFLQLLNNQNIEGSELFSAAFLENIKLIGLLWILGVTIIGIPFIFVILAVRGFITGFSSGFVIMALGLKGILFTVFTMLLKEIIIVPCLIAIGVNGINFSMRLAKNKSAQGSLTNSLKSSFLSYCFVTAFFSCFILAGVILDAYITPVFVRIIAPMLTA